ncbi:MAG: MarR family transcriptional regulator [Burkholderiales bacterium]|nr:MarR family transcriptional regulator [Burkholderiales bacterium]
MSKPTLPDTNPAAFPPAVPAPVDFYRANGYRPEESAGYLMRQILNTVSQEVDLQLAHTGLTNAQWIPLFKLFVGQASTPAELARECRLDAGAMTRTLDRMEAKGLCRRERSASDRRVVTITLTEAGREAAQVIPEVLSRVQNAHLAGFSRDEFELLKSFLRRILVNASAIDAAHTHDTSSPIPQPTGGPDAA